MKYIIKEGVPTNLPREVNIKPEHIKVISNNKTEYVFINIHGNSIEKHEIGFESMGMDCFEISYVGFFNNL